MLTRAVLASVLLLQAVAVTGQQPAAAEIQQLLRAGNLTKAEETARLHLAAVEREHGPSSTATASALELLVEALWRGGKAAAPEARTLAERAVSIKETALGPSHVDVSSALISLASVLAERGDHSQAIPVFERALTIREAARGPGDLSVASALNDLGLSLSALARYAAARPVYERALRIREAASPDSLVVAGTLHNLANLLKDTGEYQEAEPLYARSLSIREALEGPDSGSVATALHGLAFLRIEQGRYTDARTLYDRVIAIRQRSYPPGHPEIAKSFTNLAIALAQSGANEDAKPLFAQAYEMLERAHGPAHSDVIQARGNLGLIAQRTGDFVMARTLAEQALADRERRTPENKADIATALHNLGAIHREIGDYQEAIGLYRRALVLRETALGLDSAPVASTLNNLAAALVSSGKNDEARVTSERAIRIFEARVGKTHLNVAQALGNYAIALQNLGQFDAAEAALVRALGIYETAYSPQHPSVAAALDNLAENHHRTGAHEKAQAAYARALGIRSASLGSSHPHLSPGLVGLARESLEVGDRERAVASAVQAETTGREHLRLTLSTLPERQALTAAAARSAGLDLLMSLAAADDRSVELTRTAFDTLIRSRALVADEMARRRQLGVMSTDAEVTRQVRELADARRRLANLTVRGPKGMTAVRHEAMLADVRRDQERIERLLAETRVPFRRASAEVRTGLDEVAAALSDDSVVLSFVRYVRQVVAKPGASVTALPSYLAFVARRREPPVAIPLGDAAQIDQLVSKWRSAVRSPSRGEAAYRRVGEELRRRVWDPAAPALRGARMVLIVPDGDLSLVNFGALPVDSGTYLVELAAILHYASAERDLVLDPAATATGAGMLALGGAAFDAAASTTPASNRSAGESGTSLACADFARVKFRPLAGTAAEVRDVSSAWAADSTIVRLSGARATEAALKELAPGKAVVHLATHGFFLDGRCPESSDASRAVGGLKTKAAPQAASHPLRLSGLAVAGANRRALVGPDAEDGIVTAEEIASIDLTGVRWAVLSACDTGLGEIRAGEGVLGLRRAFRVAGAATVIMSLWSVDDEATRLWMGELYRNRFARKMGTAEAIRAATTSRLMSLRTAKKAAHPFYWAAFLGSGDWR